MWIKLDMVGSANKSDTLSRAFLLQAAKYTLLYSTFLLIHLECRATLSCPVWLAHDSAHG